MQIGTSSNEPVRNDATQSPCRTTVGAVCRSAAIVGVAALMVWCLGCATKPRAYISDPAVYTLDHLANIQQNDVGASEVTLSGDLKRYFRTTPEAYKTQGLRMDSMLDNTQRASEELQAIQTSLAIALTMNMLGSTGSQTGSSPTDLPAPPGKLQTGLLEKLMKDMRKNPLEPVADSPFDMLDRTTDFYVDYLIKLLKRYPDSRT